MRYDVSHRHTTYTVVDDRTLVLGAAVTGRLVDETTGEGVRAPGVLRVHHPAMRGRVVDGGRFAIACLPAVDLPDLDSTAHDIVASVSVPAFVEHEATFALPAGTTLPLDAGDVVLRRRPVRLQGRATHAITGAPVAGALVFAANPAAAQPAVAVRWPLRFDHDAGVAVRRRSLLETATVTALASAARGGDRTLALASRAGLAAGAVVRLGTGDEVEIAVLAGVSAEPADPALPGTVTLTAPLHRGFAAMAPARVLDPDVVPQTRTLTSAAHAGDGLLLLDGGIAPDTVHTLEILDPGRVEYLLLGTVTDGDGFYALDGLGRVAEVRLVARAAGLADAARTVAVDYGTPAGVVNFSLEP